MSARHYVEDLPPWERHELQCAAQAFEAGGRGEPLLLDDWQLIITAEVNLISGWVAPPGHGTRLITVVIVGADPGLGRVYTVVGWLTLGASVDRVSDLPGELELLEEEARELRDALLRS